MPQARLNNNNLPLCLCDGKIRDNFTVAQYAPAILPKGQVMGKQMLIAGAVVDGVGNVGNGTVTGFALAATPGAVAKVGTYNLRCIDQEGGDALEAAVTNFVGAGNGTVTLLTAADPVKQGVYLLECIDQESNDDLSISGVTATRVGVSDGTLTGEAISAVGAPAKQGDWVCECIEAVANGGIFRLIDPDGIVVGAHIEILGGAGGTAVWDGAGITFTLTDGAADFDLGDFFTITVIGEHGGRFQLTDPDGIVLDNNILLPGGAGGAVAVNVGGLAFTLTDGAADFENGDVFDITVVGLHGGVFELVDPSGIVIENHIQMPGTAGGTVTVVCQGITFVITDGANDFEVNDSFTMTVGAGSMLIPVTDAATADGSNLPLYVLAEEVDARLGNIANVSAYIKGDMDAQQLALLGTATLNTNIAVDNIVKTIREWLDDVGIVAVHSNYIDGFENV